MKDIILFSLFIITLLAACILPFAIYFGGLR